MEKQKGMELSMFMWTWQQKWQQWQPMPTTKATGRTTKTMEKWWRRRSRRNNDRGGFCWKMTKASLRQLPTKTRMRKRLSKTMKKTKTGSNRRRRGPESGGRLLNPNLPMPNLSPTETRYGNGGLGPGVAAPLLPAALGRGRGLRNLCL